MDGGDVARLMLAAVLIYVVLKVGGAFWRALNGDSASATRHCMQCGTDGVPATVTKGSIGIEVVFWLCFLVPGLIYSLWRLTTRHQACATCGATNLVPINTPAAVAHKASLSGPAKAAQ
jgi:hypothetical protein